MASQRALEMDFNTELGKSFRIRVYDAKEDLTSMQVSSAMDDIIEKNVFHTPGGNLTGKIAARIVVTDKTDFDLV